MKVVEFGGGLGDVFIQIYKSNAYTQLDSLKAGEHVKIVLLSANPGVRDLFRWHPKSSQFEIIDIRSAVPWGPCERKKLGIEEPTILHGRNNTQVNFYPSEGDLTIINSIPKPFVVFGISAGHSIINIPQKIAEEAADIALSQNVNVVLVGRNFYSIIKNVLAGTDITMPREEVRLTWREGIYDTIDKLSVPGLTLLLREAVGVFCCHNCLAPISWQLRRPVFVLWHEWKRIEWEQKAETTWGRAFPETSNLCLSNWDPKIWAIFLGRFKRYCTIGI